MGCGVRHEVLAGHVQDAWLAPEAEDPRYPGSPRNPMHGSWHHLAAAAGAVHFRFGVQTSYTWLFSIEKDADYCWLRLFILPSAGDSSSYLGSGG